MLRTKRRLSRHVSSHQAVAAEVPSKDVLDKSECLDASTRIVNRQSRSYMHYQPVDGTRQLFDPAGVPDPLPFLAKIANPTTVGSVEPCS